MPLRSLRAALAALALVLVAAGCGDDANGPVVVPEGQLVILKLDATAPPLAATVATFWAKKGQDTEARLYYRPRLGSTDSTEFLRFRVASASLLAYPDGSPIADGDSVLITITVPNPRAFLANFQPAGLRFSPTAPARLEWEIEEADDDLDEDGDVDAADAGLVQALRIWRQPTPGASFTALQTEIEIDDDEIEVDANVTSFSNYVVAYRSSRPAADQ